MTDRTTPLGDSPLLHRLARSLPGLAPPAELHQIVAALAARRSLGAGP